MWPSAEVPPADTHIFILVHNKLCLFNDTTAPQSDVLCMKEAGHIHKGYSCVCWLVCTRFDVEVMCHYVALLCIKGQRLPKWVTSLTCFLYKLWCTVLDRLAMFQSLSTSSCGQRSHNSHSPPVFLLSHSRTFEAPVCLCISE